MGHDIPWAFHGFFHGVGCLLRVIFGWVTWGLRLFAEHDIPHFLLAAGDMPQGAPRDFLSQGCLAAQTFDGRNQCFVWANSGLVRSLWWLHASANLKEVLSSCLAIINVCLILNVCKLAHDAVVPQEKFELGSPPLLCDVAQPICIPTQIALTLGSRKCKFITQHIKSCCCFSLPGSAGYCRFLQNDPAAIATCDFEEGAQEIERQNVINLQPDFGIFGTWATDHWSDLFTHQLGTEIPWLLEVISGFCREVWET